MNSDLNAIISFLNEHNDIEGSFIRCLSDFEKKKNFDSQIREKLTGPLVDLLFKNNGIRCKTLSNGIKFQFVHQNKITRDFILSPQEKPDFVWEPQTSRILLHFSLHAKNVLVGGAYIGDHAILIANQIKKNGGVCHTFEPDAKAIEFLKRNAKINDIDNIRINQLALWQESGKLIKLEGEDVLGSSVEIASGDGISTVTIDDYVTTNKLDKLNLIMLDIEGGEYNALKGAKKVLEKLSTILIFETHSLYNDWSNGLHNAEVMLYVKSMGYDLYAIRDFHSNVATSDLKIELIPIDRTDISGPPHGFNVLAVPDSSLLNDNLFSIVKDVSPKLFVDRNTKMNLPFEWIK